MQLVAVPVNMICRIAYPIPYCHQAVIAKADYIRITYEITVVVCVPLVVVYMSVVGR